MVAQTINPPTQEERDAHLLFIVSNFGRPMRMGEIVAQMPVGRSAVASQLNRLIKEGRIATNKQAVAQPGDTRYWVINNKEA